MITAISIGLYAFSCYMCGVCGKTAGRDVALGYTVDTSPNVDGVYICTALGFIAFVAASALQVWG